MTCRNMSKHQKQMKATHTAKTKLQQEQQQGMRNRRPTSLAKGKNNQAETNDFHHHILSLKTEPWFRRNKHRSFIY